MSVFDDYRRQTWNAGADIAPEQTELATSLRVPFVSSPYPRWNYITGVVVSDLYGGIVPDDDEVRMISSFVEEYCVYFLNDAFRAVMAELAPYDIDGGANLAYLIKHESGGWSYRQRTWTQGPLWMPGRAARADLLSVLDRRNTIVDTQTEHWLRWKAEHPEVFGVVAS